MTNLSEFVSKLFLFADLDIIEIEKILKTIKIEIKTFSRSDIIYSPYDYEKKIGFVVSGKCDIRRIKSDGTTVVINTLEPYDSFGVLAIFSESSDFPTQVYSTVTSEIMFMSKDDVLFLIKKYPDIAMNVIKFMTGRIEFLNGKIATFSGTHVESRLASYIIGEYKRRSNTVIPFNCKKSAEAINAGRASVYRAIEYLVSEKFIEYQSKKIILIDPEGLERIAK